MVRELIKHGREREIESKKRERGKEVQKYPTKFPQEKNFIVMKNENKKLWKKKNFN